MSGDDGAIERRTALAGGDGGLQRRFFIRCIIAPARCWRAGARRRAYARLTRHYYTSRRLRAVTPSTGAYITSLLLAALYRRRHTSLPARLTTIKAAFGTISTTA